jgi:hypothetical protein
MWEIVKDLFFDHAYSWVPETGCGIFDSFVFFPSLNLEM